MRTLEGGTTLVGRGWGWIHRGLALALCAVLVGCSAFPEHEWSEVPVTNNPHIIQDTRPMMGIPL